MINVGFEKCAAGRRSGSMVTVLAEFARIFSGRKACGQEDAYRRGPANKATVPSGSRYTLSADYRCH